MSGWVRGITLVVVIAVVTLVLAQAPTQKRVRAESGPSARPPPRDVVLIVIDTLRADHLTEYGYGRATAPNLSALARESVLYSHATSPGTWTVPAHGSIFTGLWPSFHGAERTPGPRMTARPLRVESRTLAEILAGIGFHPAAFVGNWTFVTPSLGFGRGFREFFDGEVAYPPRLADDFARWLPGRHDRLFVFVNFLDPHEPYEPPPPLDTLFPSRHAELGTRITKAVYDEKKPVTPELVEHFTSQYDGEIVFVDRALGSLLASLKRAGRYDDALIVVTSDHGELFGEHGLAGHALAPYEPLLRVPLLVRFPGGRRAGEVVDRRVSTRSIFATVLAAVGVPQPPGVDAPTLDQPHEVWVEHVNEAGFRQRAGYDGALKVKETNRPDGTVREVFDLALDPGELRPLPELGGAAAEPLRRALDAFAAQERPANDQSAPTVDPEREVQLRRLGYVR